MVFSIVVSVHQDRYVLVGTMSVVLLQRKPNHEQDQTLCEWINYNTAGKFPIDASWNRRAFEIFARPIHCQTFVDALSIYHKETEGNGKKLFYWEQKISEASWGDSIIHVYSPISLLISGERKKVRKRERLKDKLCALAVSGDKASGFYHQLHNKIRRRVR